MNCTTLKKTVIIKIYKRQLLVVPLIFHFRSLGKLHELLKRGYVTLFAIRG